MNKEKVKQFVKDHKVKLIAGCIVSVGVGCAYVIMNKGRVRMPGFTIHGGLTIADIGKLGEEFMKHDPDLTMDTEILEVGHFKFE